jgi:hypothetical protein
MEKNDQQLKILIVDKFYYRRSNNFDRKLTEIIVDNLTDRRSGKVDEKSILPSTTDRQSTKKVKYCYLNS